MRIDVFGSLVAQPFRAAHAAERTPEGLRDDGPRALLEPSL
jgi:hypothetical protein